VQLMGCVNSKPDHAATVKHLCTSPRFEDFGDFGGLGDLDD